MLLHSNVWSMFSHCLLHLVGNQIRLQIFNSGLNIIDVRIHWNMPPIHSTPISRMQWTGHDNDKSTLDNFFAYEGFLLIFINSTRWDVMSMIVRESNSTFLLLTLGIHKSIKSIATSSHKVIFTAPLYVNNHSPCWTIYIHDNAHTWSCQWCIWAWDDDNVPALAVFHKITFFNGVHD